MPPARRPPAPRRPPAARGGPRLGAALGLAFAAALPAPLPARAQDGVVVRIAVDDRGPARLQAPSLRLDQQPPREVPLQDDGQIPGDVPGDRIFVARAEAQRQETLTFTVLDGGAEVGRLVVSLPASGAADFAVKTTEGEPGLVLDLRAPSMPAAAAAPASAPLVVTAAPAGETVDAGDDGADRINVLMLVDDRALGRLKSGAEVRVQQDGVAAGPLLDDGEGEDATAEDGVYATRVTVARAQYLQLELWVDPRGDAASIGAVNVFLPSSSEAMVRLRTREGSPGLELVTEPTALGATDAPTSGPAGAPSGGGGGGADRFVHVLWVGIALAALGFGYVRSVVGQIWASELRPVVQRLDLLLQDELARRGRGAGPAGPAEGGDG
jgi:hypothetical protein